MRQYQQVADGVESTRALIKTCSTATGGHRYADTGSALTAQPRTRLGLNVTRRWSAHGETYEVDQGKEEDVNSSTTPPISVTILTLNEEAKLVECLASVSWADEIVVVDSGSTDRTVQIAKMYGASVWHQSWLGFAMQKNFAASVARNDWILNVDADERVGNDFVAALQRVTLTRPAYSVVRVSDFLGMPHRPVHRPAEERLVRLYDRRRAAFGTELVHEKVQTSDSSEPIDLQGTIFHEGFRGVADFTDRLNTYSTLLAAQNPRRTSSVRILARPAARLVWSLFRHRNVLDGRRGIALSALWACHDLLVEIKRLESELGSEGTAFDSSLFASADYRHTS